MVDTGELLFFLAAVLLSISVYVFYQFNLRRRNRILAGEVKVPPEDRAFNQIRITRAAASHLANQGHDVSGVNATLDGAESRYARRDHAGALRLAEEAREQLRAAKDRPRSRPPPPRSPSALRSEDGGASPEPAEVSSDRMDGPRPATTTPKLPKGMVEARFTLSLLDQDIESARRERTVDPRLGEVEHLRKEAGRAFDEQRYSDAWTTALRARRRLGSSVEAISGSSAASPTPDEADTEEADPETPGASCAQCGRALRGGERFCRGCGASIAAHRCPRCGAQMEAADAYCHACGAPVGA
ncbi:MAG: zinc ribbon domain-containing protein [Thermoplasmata archaeon]|nr:zinc ribbon domain-containing protein [Thermoplasmata archaeon]MCI4341336.1 zinc ribbon domain-containing protein [Thermoplasmata archaeon]